MTARLVDDVMEQVLLKSSILLNVSLFHTLYNPLSAAAAAAADVYRVLSSVNTAWHTTLRQRQRFVQPALLRHCNSEGKLRQH